MGFTLAKIVVNPTPEGGWAKHVFYDTDDGFGADGGLIAFWELHGDYPAVDGAMSRSVGSPRLGQPPGVHRGRRARTSRQL